MYDLGVDKIISVLFFVLIHTKTTETCSSPSRNPENFTNFPILNLFSTGATTTDLPPGVLYRVKATYKYKAEDNDELNFDVGEIINVIEYDDPEDQVRIFINFS